MNRFLRPLVLRSLAGLAAWALAATGVLVAALLTYRVAERVGYARLADAAMHQLDLYAAGIDSELNRYDSLPSIIELETAPYRLLDRPADPALRDAVNKLLLNLSVRMGSLAISLLDPQGKVLATSNWYEGDSLLGRSLAEAPFFEEALRTGHARSFAADPVRHTPEYSFARALMQRERVVGVVVVRVSLASIERTWVEYAAGSNAEKLLVIDDDGVVLMSSNPAWRYRTLAPLPAGQRAALQRTGRYPPTPLEPLGLQVEQRLGYDTRLVRLADGPGRAQRFLAEEQDMVRPGWRLMTLSAAAPVQRDARNLAGGAAAAAALVALGALFLRHRRRAVRQQLAARAALQRAKDELELRVHERTAELRAEIAERERTERELRETQHELVAAGRLALLGQMSAAITHEINQPLTALRALSDNGRRQLAAGRLANVERNLGQIADLTDRLGRITAQLKSFARKTPSPAAPMRLAGAVANTLQLLSSRLEADGVQVRAEVPDDLRVVADGYRIEQVLLNLATNALDAMKTSPERRLRIEARIDGERVRVRVADSGGGVPEAVLARLFEPFFSTKPPGEGLGLGLVISNGIVQEFGGRLRAANEGGGAVFEFDLQLEKENVHA